MSRAIVLLSGGMDSAIALHWARRDFVCVAVAVDYGQRHLTELVSARRIAKIAYVELHEVRISIPWGESSLVGDRGDVVVPGRNTILASLAAMHAQREDVVVMGCCADDAERFPDCRPEFVRALSETLRLSLGVTVVAPLLGLTKAGSLRLASKIPGAWDAIRRSWSCYTPKDSGARRPVACGECLACIARARGFAEIGESDPGRV